MTEFGKKFPKFWNLGLVLKERKDLKNVTIRKDLLCDNFVKTETLEAREVRKRTDRGNKYEKFYLCDLSSSFLHILF